MSHLCFPLLMYLLGQGSLQGPKSGHGNRQVNITPNLEMANRGTVVAPTTPSTLGHVHSSSKLPVSAASFPGAFQ